MDLWQVWAIIALVFIIIEIFTSGFAVACFSFGAVGAAVASATGLSLIWQLLIFAILSVIAFIFVRPVIIKLFYKKMSGTSTNADALIGRNGTVSRYIPSQGRGRVAIDGDDWRAVSCDGKDIAEGTPVTIVDRIDSVTLSVRSNL